MVVNQISAAHGQLNPEYGKHKSDYDEILLLIE